MENTTENKTKFFTQYWGQKVYFQTGQPQLAPIEVNMWTIMETDNLLILKSLYQISDEDAIEVGNILGLKQYYLYYQKIEWVKTHLVDGSVTTNIGITFSTNVQAFQYLLSKGYALPYMGLSVEELVAYGWIEVIK